MSDELLLKSVGGRQLMRGNEVAWNFGVHPKNDAIDAIVSAAPSVHDRFPALGGKWDGKTTVNHHLAAYKVLGPDGIPIQQQPRGTCGGRSGKGTMQLLQCVMIAMGQRAKYHNVSHAAVYYMARKIAGMLSGNPSNENNDGVASGSVPEALAKLGCVQVEEDGDTNWYGEGSDDLAVQLGCGRMKDLAAKIDAAGADNLVTAWAPCKSAQELADGIASGGVGICSDDQGYTMTRDKDGFCSPRGSWAHYQMRSGVIVLPNGRKGFAYNQSWGKNVPDGPLLPDHPSNCFGVDWDVQDHLCKTADVAVVWGFQLWDLEAGRTDVPWSFQ